MSVLKEIKRKNKKMLEIKFLFIIKKYKKILLKISLKLNI